MRTHEDNPQDWYFLAAEKLDAADALVASCGVTYSGVKLLHEAAERYLKGYLIANGWQLARIHDLQLMVDEAQRFNPAFEGFREMAALLTQQFYAQWYPGGDLTGVGSNYDELRQQVDDLVALIAPQS